MISGNVLTTVSSSALAVGNAWASVSAALGTQYQVLGFNAGASAAACYVQLRFGTAPKIRMHSVSGASISEWFGEFGPVAAEKQGVAVWAKNGSAGAAHDCWANLYYRAVK